MSKICSILIVGSKRAGKSTLFRRLLKKKDAKQKSFYFSPLVNYQEEVLEINNKSYKLIDTPSFIFKNIHNDKVTKEIFYSLENLIEKSDLVLWVISSREVVDEEIIKIRRALTRKKKNFIPVVSISNEKNSKDFNFFGIKNFLEFSILKNGTESEIELLKQKINLFFSKEEEENTDNRKPDEKKLSLLIFGPPNSGKSTLMNFLLNENRSIATEIPGTTKEPVISDYRWKNFNFQLVDTAGITREIKSSKKLWINCDLAWAVVDVTSSLTKQILKIVNLSEKNEKPLVILVNKCDLVKSGKKELELEIRSRLKSLSFCPIINISALKGDNINLLMEKTEKFVEESKIFLGKKELERLVNEMVEKNPPNFWNNGRLKIYYAKQEPGLVQKFIFFVNNEKFVHFSYERYISNYLRRKIKLDHLPIKIIFKNS